MSASDGLIGGGEDGVEKGLIPLGDWGGEMDDPLPLVLLKAGMNNGSGLAFLVRGGWWWWSRRRRGTSHRSV